MNIETILADRQAMPEEHALIAKRPFSWGSEAKLVKLTTEYRVPQSELDMGFEYLLGKEDICNLLDFLKVKKMSHRAKTEFIIHYAIYDAYPGWIEDIPDAL
jgi:hypothetical protein